MAGSRGRTPAPLDRQSLAANATHAAPGHHGRGGAAEGAQPPVGGWQQRGRRASAPALARWFPAPCAQPIPFRFYPPGPCLCPCVPAPPRSNIVKYFGSVKTRSHLYIVLEFMENGALRCGAAGRVGQPAGWDSRRCCCVLLAPQPAALVRRWRPLLPLGPPHAPPLLLPLPGPCYHTPPHPQAQLGDQAVQVWALPRVAGGRLHPASAAGGCRLPGSSWGSGCWARLGYGDCRWGAGGCVCSALLPTCLCVRPPPAGHRRAWPICTTRGWCTETSRCEGGRLSRLWRGPDGAGCHGGCTPAYDLLKGRVGARHPPPPRAYPPPPPTAHCCAGRQHPDHQGGPGQAGRLWCGSQGARRRCCASCPRALGSGGKRCS